TAPAVFFMGVPSANLADGYVVLRFGSSGDAGPENLQTSRTLAEDGADRTGQTRAAARRAHREERREVGTARDPGPRRGESAVPDGEGPRIARGRRLAWLRKDSYELTRRGLLVRGSFGKRRAGFFPEGSAETPSSSSRIRSTSRRRRARERSTSTATCTSTSSAGPARPSSGTA